MNKVTKIDDNKYTVGLFTVTLKNGLDHKSSVITDDQGETVDNDILKEHIVDKIKEQKNLILE